MADEERSAEDQDEEEEKTVTLPLQYIENVQGSCSESQGSCIVSPEEYGTGTKEAKYAEKNGRAEREVLPEKRRTEGLRRLGRGGMGVVHDWDREGALHEVGYGGLLHRQKGRNIETFRGI